MIRWTTLAAAVLLLQAMAVAGDGPQTPLGWRGNSTGLFPEAQVPAQWSNISTGPVQGMKCAATMPADKSDKDAVGVEGGLVRPWLVIGPFAIDDANKDFAKEVIPNEAQLLPKVGDKAGELSWRNTEAATDGVSFYHIKAAVEQGDRNKVGYAFTWLYAAKPGKVRAAVEHVVGMKAYVNGKEAYSDPEQRTVMASAYGLSRARLANSHPVGPAFEFDVNRGWNRLLVKLVAPNKSQWNDLTFFLRLSDVADAKYDRKNILWMTPLPDHGNGGPIVVGDKVFVTAEPDELICIDKNSGKILWNATNTYADATPQAERDANPAFQQKIEPLMKQAKEARDIVPRCAARKNLQDALLEMDKAKYSMDVSDHLAAHFEIVGFSTTPCSDGKYVYVWTGTGVAACYDLDGKRQWIRRMEPGHLSYSASPAIIEGKLAVFFRKMYGLDTRTGEIAWQQPDVDKTIASLLAAKIAGVNVFISQQGEVVRASDGKMLWKNSAKIVNDTGWCAGVVSGDVLYQPWYGINQVFVVDFAGCSGDEWKPNLRTIGEIAKDVPQAKGDQGGAWMAASPLVHEGLLYAIDIHSRYYVVDLKSGKRLAWKDLGLPGESNYVSLPITASPTLVGKTIVVMDNQGHAVVLEPGSECKEIARNTLATQIQRDWAMTTQEYVSYSPPVADGKRMYLRGEKYLYCLGEK